MARHNEGWYETKLPWWGNHSPLPNNKNSSKPKLKSLTRELKSKNQTAQYKEIIDEQQKAGVVETAENKAVGTEFYIPHKPVIRPCADVDEDESII